MTNDSARACEKVGDAEFTSEVDTADEIPKCVDQGIREGRWIYSATLY